MAMEQRSLAPWPRQYAPKLRELESLRFSQSGRLKTKSGKEPPEWTG